MWKIFQSFFLRYEMRIITLIFLLLWGITAYSTYYFQIGGQGGDTTFATQILYNFRHTLAMDSTFARSIMDSFDHVWYQSAEQVCSNSLDVQNLTVPWGHFYFVMYLFVPLVKIFDVQMLVAVSHSGIYIAVLFFTYVLARKKKFSILNSILLTTLVSQHPLWDAGIHGQFYFNRFFLPFSALILLILESDRMKYKTVFLFIACLLALSTNEIYGISIFIILFSYMWIYSKWNTKTIGMAILFLFMSVLLLFLIQLNVGKATQTSYLRATFGGGIETTVKQLISSFQDPNTMQFISVNILFLGILACFNVRLAVPFVLIILPNILVGIGGAEKIGWSTHYHMSYFVPIIWLSVLGLQSLRKHPHIQSGVIILVILVSSFINPLDLSISRKPNFVLKRWIQRIQYEISHEKTSLLFRRQLREAVQGGSVSAPEAVVYNLYDHDIYYYPVNLDKVDTVILRYDETKSGDERYYSINYGHQDPKLDACIRERMKRNGFDFSNPTIVYGWAVIRKK